MARSRKTLLVAIAVGLTAVAFPAAAQDAPEAPDVRDRNEAQTGTRLPMIEVIGAISDPRARKRAERPADTSVPELPVVYE